MKKIIFPLLLICLIGCKPSKFSNSTAVTRSEVGEYVTFLASDEIEGRETGSEGIEKGCCDDVFRRLLTSFTTDYDISTAGWSSGLDRRFPQSFVRHQCNVAGAAGSALVAFPIFTPQLAQPYPLEDLTVGQGPALHRAK